MNTILRLASRSIPDALQGMDRRGRWLLAAAVFFLFSTMGPLIVLMEPNTVPAPWDHTYYLTLLSGSFAASIILSYRRPFALALVIAAFLVVKLDIVPLERWLIDLPERPEVDLSAPLGLSAQEHRSAVQNRRALGATAVILLGVGYTLFVVAVSRESKRRAAVEAEIQLARSVHEALVPKHGVRTGWCLADGWTVPATNIGGDVYDIVSPSPDRLVVFVADASGHGVGAGLVAAMTKSMLIHDIPRSATPSELLTSVNATLHRLTERGVFVTAVVAFIDRERQEVEVATAGHPAALHRRADGTTDPIRTPSVPLGASPTTRYRSERRTWRPGDRLALYSDGLTEARNAGGTEFGVEQLTDMLASADPLLEVRDAVDRHIGGPARTDDHTFVLVSASGG